MKQDYFDEIDSWKNKRVLIIGDIMLDHYLYGESKRISPEAPIPIVKTRYEQFNPGGAANVAKNIWSLEAIPILVGVVGSDYNGNKLKNILEKNNICTDWIVTSIDPRRPTTTKTRIIVHNQQISRFDREWDSTLDSIDRSNIINKLNEVIKDIDVIIISDYNKGVISSYITNYFSDKTDKIIIVDPKPCNMKYYDEIATYITPNHHEAFEMCNLSSGNINYAANFILSNLSGCKGVLITRGKEGMSFYSNMNKPIHVRATSKNVFDVIGAGDTAISIFALTMTNSLNIEDSVNLANIGAGVVIQEMGTVSITKEKLKRAVEDYWNANTKENIVN